jgi:hypothetical protein
MKIWLKIPGYSDYAVSEDGEVKRITEKTNTWSGRLLKQRKDNGGYLYVHLYNGKHSLNIHRLVAMAFLGPCPAGSEVNHKDGDRTNNHYKNLEYVTKGQNLSHAYKIGNRNHKGENHPEAKLFNHQITQIKKLRKSGLSCIDLARNFGISRTYVWKITSGRARIYG